MEQQQEHPSPASSQDRSKSASNNQSQSLAGSSGVPNAGIASFRRYVIHIYILCRVVLYFILSVIPCEKRFSLLTCE